MVAHKEKMVRDEELAAETTMLDEQLADLRVAAAECESSESEDDIDAVDGSVLGSLNTPDLRGVIGGSDGKLTELAQSTVKLQKSGYALGAPGKPIRADLSKAHSPPTGTSDALSRNLSLLPMSWGEGSLQSMVSASDPSSEAASTVSCSRRLRVQQMSEKHVSDWLNSVGLGLHVGTFHDEHIDGSVLASLGPADLRELAPGAGDTVVQLVATLCHVGGTQLVPTSSVGNSGSKTTSSTRQNTLEIHHH
jgi:hypothetical protein